jgi:response regulator NasT
MSIDSRREDGAGAVNPKFQSLSPDKSSGERTIAPASIVADNRSEMGGATMRVWLIDDDNGKDAQSLEAVLKQLAACPQFGLTLLAARAFSQDLTAELRGRRPDVVLVREPAWPDGPWTQDLLGLGLAVVVATSPERCERFRGLADTHAVSFVPLRPSLECLLLALVSAAASERREAHYQNQVARLQQRLSDRIVIERAKGVLVQRLGVTEEDAYKRLRVLSRRQRRQIRDIAQSLLDTQALLLPGGNGFMDHAASEHLDETAKPPPPA